MDEQILEQVENWCFTVRAGELEQYLTALNLTSGTRFAKLNRLTSWLLGTYTPENFTVSSGNAFTDWVSRQTCEKPL